MVSLSKKLISYVINPSVSTLAKEITECAVFLLDFISKEPVDVKEVEKTLEVMENKKSEPSKEEKSDPMKTPMPEPEPTVTKGLFKKLGSLREKWNKNR